jgi:hypothetical protein
VPRQDHPVPEPHEPGRQVTQVLLRPPGLQGVVIDEEDGRGAGFRGRGSHRHDSRKDRYSPAILRRE